MIVAERLGRFDTIGIDCVAMNVNDLICVGAEPIAMVDFILCERADPEVCGEIGVGLRRGAELAGIEIPGGEIAQVGEIVTGWELGGDGVGTVALEALVTGESIEPGDAVLGLPSSGSTPTATRSRGRCSPTSTRPRIPTAGWAGPSATSCSSRPRSTCARCSSCCGPRSRCGVSPTSGRAAQLTRLAAPVGYEIDDPLPVPPIFDLIRELGEVADDEMYEVFNMGYGFCCVVRRARRVDSAGPSRAPHPGARRIGTVTPRAGLIVER